MVIKNRNEWLEKNKTQLVTVLEHITNVTNLGLSLKEVENNLVISFRNDKMNRSQRNTTDTAQSGADLIFSQDPNKGMKVRHRFFNGPHPPEEETVARIPASAVNQIFIYEKVIEFLERVKQQ